MHQQVADGVNVSTLVVCALCFYHCTQADKARVMDYINRLDNFDGPEIAKIAASEQVTSPSHDNNTDRTMHGRIIAAFVTRRVLLHGCRKPCRFLCSLLSCIRLALTFSCCIVLILYCIPL